MRHTKILLMALILLSISCKKECHGFWTIKGRLLNGTTLKPIPHVELEYMLASGHSGLFTQSHTEIIGRSFTDDSGFFNFPYECDNGYKWHTIVIMSRNTNTGISANEDFQTYFEKTFYWSDTGTMQINLKAKTPLNGDTLYLAFDQPINFSHNFIYTDSFTSSNIPKLWKTLKGKPGGGRGVYWGRGKAEFINAKKDLLKNNFIKVRISEDPTIDIYTIEY